jgi:hypothetical protein
MSRCVRGSVAERRCHQERELNDEVHGRLAPHQSQPMHVGAPVYPSAMPSSYPPSPPIATPRSPLGAALSSRRIALSTGSLAAAGAALSLAPYCAFACSLFLSVSQPQARGRRGRVRARALRHAAPRQRKTKGTDDKAAQLSSASPLPTTPASHSRALIAPAASSAST